MNTKRITILYLLLTGLFLSACRSGQTPVIVNTLLPASTATITTPTRIPTFTPVPPTPTLYKGIQDPESGHRYLVLKEMEWDEAKEYCSRLGGYLAMIESAPEDNFVYNSVFKPRNDQSIFLGASDKDQESHWVWGTGEEMQYKNWAENEPNNCGSSETSGKCGAENYLTYHSDPPGQWNDASSTGSGRFICEFEN